MRIGVNETLEIVVINPKIDTSYNTYYIICIMFLNLLTPICRIHTRIYRIPITNTSIAICL